MVPVGKKRPEDLPNILASLVSSSMIVGSCVGIRSQRAKVIFVFELNLSDQSLDILTSFKTSSPTGAFIIALIIDMHGLVTVSERRSLWRWEGYLVE
jgi:hypothetical protein